jgi:single-stranded-DNA-specific exonuclease
VADVVPLVEENRLLVQQGVAVLNRLERVGLRELIFAADISAEEITADKISFAIAPRINAAGRMGRSYRAFELLTTDDENEAKQLAGEVCFENMRRQDVEAVVTDACRIEYMQSGMQIYDRVIVIAGYNWHRGVLGIVAARICAQFGKPTIILTIDGDTAKGSARSIEGFDLFAALSACSDCLLQYGGHTLAAGVSIETDRICEFREQINQYARSLGKRPVPQLSIDCKLSPLGAGERTATAIQCLTPHGCQNPAPIFALMNMEIDAIQPVGGGKSLRLTMSKDGVTVVCMKFSTSAQDFPFYVGDFVDVAVAFRYGTFRNRPAFSMAVQDIRPAGFNDQDMFCEMNLFEDFMAGVDISKESRLQLLPSREELGIVFRFLRKSQHLKIQPDVLMAKMDYVISMGKILVALKVFEEFDFIRYEFDGDFLHVEYLSPTEKHDLSNSQILLKLQM